MAKPTATIRLKRAYEAAGGDDGKRFLVDRLWPRGVKKSSIAIDGWLKDAAPSNDLRNWYHRDPAQWNEFSRRYVSELKANEAAWLPLFEAARHGVITLLYSSHDVQHNNAVALRDFLIEQLRASHKR